MIDLPFLFRIEDFLASDSTSSLLRGWLMSEVRTIGAIMVFSADKLLKKLLAMFKHSKFSRYMPKKGSTRLSKLSLSLHRIHFQSLAT